MDKIIAMANKILSKAAQNDQTSALGKLFRQVKGVAMISELEEEEDDGFKKVSGPVGSGIVLARDDTTGNWSDPCACTLGGTGWGVGSTSKEIIVFILDQESMTALTSTQTGLELSEGASLVTGTLEAGSSSNVSGSHFVSKSDTGLAQELTNGGVGTLSIAFTEGTYVSATANGASIYPSDELNCDFYKKQISAKDLLRP